MFYGTAAVSAAIFDATVVPLLMIDHPRTNEHLREYEILTAGLLSPRLDEIVDDVIIAISLGSPETAMRKSPQCR